jgi:hypothetical protein
MEQSVLLPSKIYSRKAYLQRDDIELQRRILVVFLNNIGDLDNLGHGELVCVHECQSTPRAYVGTCYLLTKRVVLSSCSGELCSGFRGVNLVASDDLSICSHGG